MQAAMHLDVCILNFFKAFHRKVYNDTGKRSIGSADSVGELSPHSQHMCLDVNTAIDNPIIAHTHRKKILLIFHIPSCTSLNLVVGHLAIHLIFLRVCSTSICFVWNLLVFEKYYFIFLSQI